MGGGARLGGGRSLSSNAGGIVPTGRRHHLRGPSAARPYFDTAEPILPDRSRRGLLWDVYQPPMARNRSAGAVRGPYLPPRPPWSPGGERRGEESGEVTQEPLMSLHSTEFLT